MSSSGKKTSRKSSEFRCHECGWATVKWVGRCPECGTWGSVEEVGPELGQLTQVRSVSKPAQKIADIDSQPAVHRPTGVGEFDRVLGGGLVPGAVILLAGEPGVGKSTLLIDAAARSARSGLKVLYISGEESAAQVKLRAERIGAISDELYLTSETDLGTALGQVEQIDPDLLIVDSVQTLASAEVSGSAGGVSQVREVASALIGTAKSKGITTIVVGHVTKEGTIAGPRLLEHLVDVVCQFEGEKHSRLRLLRAVKNRYGPTDEVGCFDLTDSGIEGLADPSGLFRTRTIQPVPGTCLTVTVEGRRPLIAEVQALVTSATTPSPRRSTTGLDSSRVSMLLAILESRAGLALGQTDCFVATVGGVRLSEPAIDLAACLAVASAVAEHPLDQRMIVFGEVGLAGEVRAVQDVNRRIAEAHRLGYQRAIVPASPNGPGKIPEGMDVRTVTSLAEALHLAGFVPAGERS